MYLVNVAVKKNFIILSILKLKGHWIPNNLNYLTHPKSTSLAAKYILLGGLDQLVPMSMIKWAWNIPSMPERVNTKKANKEKVLSSSPLSEHCFPSILLLCSTLRQKRRQAQNGFNLVHDREGIPEMGKKKKST